MDLIPSTAVRQYNFTLLDFMQLSPIFISVFMLMTSLFNKDFKGLIWIIFSVLGIFCMMKIHPAFGDTSCPFTVNAPIELFSKYKNLSLSTFFILFTLTYLIIPMHANNDWNYYAIIGFLILFGADTVTKRKYFCTTIKGFLSGGILGIFYGWVCFIILKYSNANQLIYYNTSSSNNIYCTRPKKQQFKCNVYKNGEIISAL